MLPILRHVPPAEARAIVLSIVVGVTLLALKFLAYAVTGSTAILSDALESIVNVLAAGFAFTALYHAHRPADRNHPYGHGKIEFLSAAFEGGLIIAAAVMIVIEAVISLAHPRLPQQILVGLLLTSSAMLIHAALGSYLIHTGRRRGSLTLEAEGKHLLADSLTSLTALIALLIVRLTGWLYADPLGAMVVAVHIANTGVKLVRKSAAGLMDEQDAGDEAMLETILNAHIGGGGKSAREPRVCSYHNLRHRHNGRYHWVDFHLVIPRWWNIEKGHEVAGAIEGEIEQALRAMGDATAHIEPCEDDQCEFCRQSRQTEATGRAPHET